MGPRPRSIPRACRTPNLISVWLQARSVPPPTQACSTRPQARVPATTTNRRCLCRPRTRVLRCITGSGSLLAFRAISGSAMRPHFQRLQVQGGVLRITLDSAARRHSQRPVLRVWATLPRSLAGLAAQYRPLPQQDGSKHPARLSHHDHFSRRLPAAGLGSALRRPLHLREPKAG